MIHITNIFSVGDFRNIDEIVLAMSVRSRDVFAKGILVFK